MENVAISIVWDGLARDPSRAALIRNQWGTDSSGNRRIFTLNGTATLADGRTYRLEVTRTRYRRSPWSDGGLLNEAALWRDGRAVRDGALVAVRTAAIAGFLAVLDAARVADFDPAAPAWPGVDGWAFNAGGWRIDPDVSGDGIETGETGPDWEPTPATRFYAQRGPAMGFGPDTAAAIAALEADESRRAAEAEAAARLERPLIETAQPERRDWSAELEAARDACDWDAHARIWDERAAAEVEADESALEGLETEAAARLERPLIETADAQPVRTGRVVDVTPTWAAILPMLRLAVESGTAEGRRIAWEELGRMADAADGWNRLATPARHLAAAVSETRHCVPGMAGEELETANAAVYAALSVEEPEPAQPDPLADRDALATYPMRGDGIQAAGAIVLRRKPGGYVVHFRNDSDSVRMGRPAYSGGDYCDSLADGWAAFAAKIRRYDPSGTLGGSPVETVSVPAQTEESN